MLEKSKNDPACGSRSRLIADLDQSYKILSIGPWLKVYHSTKFESNPSRSDVYYRTREFSTTTDITKQVMWPTRYMPPPACNNPTSQVFLYSWPIAMAVDSTCFNRLQPPTKFEIHRRHYRHLHSSSNDSRKENTIKK